MYIPDRKILDSLEESIHLSHQLTHPHDTPSRLPDNHPPAGARVCGSTSAPDGCGLDDLKRCDSRVNKQEKQAPAERE